MNKYPVEYYDIVGNEIRNIKTDSSYNFSFPVSVSHHHVCCYLWAKKLIEQDFLSSGFSLIYLDAHSDYIISKNKVIQSSNWVGAILEEEIASQAFWVIPEWFDFNEYLEYIEVDRQDFQVIESVGALPSGSQIGPVILSIDCDYFSNIDFPHHKPTEEAIILQMKKIVSILKEKNIQIIGLNIALSPGYTHREHEVFIKEELLKAFSNY